MRREIKVVILSDGIRQRERKRLRWGPFWGLLSLLLHGLGATAIVLLTPVRELILPEESAPEPMTISADRIEDMAETLTEARVSELLRQLENLQSVLHNMDVIKVQLAKDYDAFAEQNIESIQSELTKLVAETETDQQKAVEAQQIVAAAVQEIATVEKTQDLTNADVAKDLSAKEKELKEVTSEKTNTAQANAINALDKIQVKAEFIGYEKTVQAAELLREAQIEVGKSQDAAQDKAAETVRKIADLAWAEREVKEKTERLTSHDKYMQEKQEQLVKEKEKEQKAEEERASAEQKVEEEKTAEAELREQIVALDAEKKKAEAKEMRRKIDERKRAKDHAQRQVDQKTREIKNAQEQQRRIEKALIDAESRRERIVNEKKKAEERRERDQAARPELTQRQETLAKTQQNQEELNKKLETLKQALANDTAKIEKISQGADRQENELVDKAAPETIAEAFELAKEIEAAITESYKDVKATQTALAKKMSFKAAEKITDVAKPERLKADVEALTAKPRTKADFDRQKKAQAEVVREANAMVDSTVALMQEAMDAIWKDAASAPQVKQEKSDRIERIEDSDLASQDEAAARAERLAALSAEADHQLKLEAAAAEDESATDKDLAALMAEAEVKPPEGDEKSVERLEETTPLGSDKSGPPALDAKMAGLLPGNVMDLSGTAKNAIPGDWMYVSSWYVIGPFPNPNRVNLRRKFAPESVQDLDATYVGKDGRVLKWQFMQANNFDKRSWWGAERWNRAEVEPEKSEEYAIYYAYAEIFMDRACDRWIAVGSDDRSDIWLNDVPVWGSSNKLKEWKLSEHKRRVHFQKGRNRLLVRIENGWHAIGWSVCISVDDAPAGVKTATP